MQTSLREALNIFRSSVSEILNQFPLRALIFVEHTSHSNAVTTGHDTSLNEAHHPENLEVRILANKLTPGETENLYKVKLFNSEKENGLVHEITIAYMEQLGKLYAENGEYLKAELLYKRAFVAAEDSNHGPYHPRIAALLQPLAECAIKQGKFTEATENLLRIYTIQRCQYGDEGLETLSTGANIAVMYDKQKLWQAAEEMYKQIIEGRKRRIGDSSEATLRVMENLALNYRLRSKKMWAQSAAQYKEIIGCRKNLLKRVHKNGDQQSPLLAAGEHDDDDQRSRIKADVLKLAEVYEMMGNMESRRQLFQEWSFLFSEDKSKSQ